MHGLPTHLSPSLHWTSPIWLMSLKDQGPLVRSCFPRCGLSSMEPVKAYHPLPWDTPSLFLPWGLSMSPITCPMVPAPPLSWAADLSVQNLYGLPLGFWRAGISPRNSIQAKKTSNASRRPTSENSVCQQYNRMLRLVKAGSEENI